MLYFNVEKQEARQGSATSQLPASQEARKKFRENTRRLEYLVIVTLLTALLAVPIITLPFALPTVPLSRLY